MASQTEKDTAKADSRTTRSGEYQKRVDEAEKAKASPDESTDQTKPVEPTEKKAVKGRNTATQRDTDRSQSSVTRSGAYQKRIDAAANPEWVGTTRGNTDFQVTQNNGGGSGGTVLPFTASINSDETIKVTGGYYTVGNTPVSVAETDVTADFIYLRIKHDSAGVLAATDPFIIHPSSTALDEVELDSGGDYVEYYNYLIAEVVSEAMVQYRSGNAELVLAFTSGQIHYAPILSGGKT